MLFTSTADPQNGSGDSTQSGSDTGQSGSGSDNTQAGSSGPQDTFTHPEQLPSLSLFGDAISHTGLTINTTAGTLAQYVSGTGAPGYWDNISTYGAGIALSQFRPGLVWVVAYNGGVNITTGFGPYNFDQLNQSANARATWNFAKRWQMRLKESYLYSDDPFAPYFSYLSQPTPNNPNPVTYYPQAVIEQNNAEIDLTYQLSAHDVVNFSGTEGFIRYERGGYSALYNSYSYAGAAFYQHEFSARVAAGGGYQLQALDFGHGESRAGTNVFEGFVSYVFNSHVNASVWIGPELTNTKDVVPVFCYQLGCFYEIQHSSAWSVAEGGTFHWKITPSDVVNIQGSRGVSNVGGILGAAYIYVLTGTWGRPLTHQWNLAAGVTYNDSKSISEIVGKQELHSITGTVGVSRKLFNSDAWAFNAYYAFITQNQNYFGYPADISTQGFGMAIRYSWNHGLGR